MVNLKIELKEKIIISCTVCGDFHVCLKEQFSGMDWCDNCIDNTSHYENKKLTEELIFDKQ